MAAVNKKNPATDPLAGLDVFEMDEWYDTQLERRIGLRDRDGNVHVIDPPELWPDDLARAAFDGDLVACGEMLLGKDGYAKWKKSGLNSSALMAKIEKEFHLGVGESSASSS